MGKVRVILPFHLRTLAKVDGEVEVDVKGQITANAIVDAIEARYPTLGGTVRDHATRARRAFLRYFACNEDISQESPDAPLPEAVARGIEPFFIVGAIAGG